MLNRDIYQPPTNMGGQSHPAPVSRFTLPVALKPQALDGAGPDQARAMPRKSLATMRQGAEADGAAQAQQAQSAILVAGYVQGTLLYMGFVWNWMNMGYVCIYIYVSVYYSNVRFTYV